MKEVIVAADAPERPSTSTAMVDDIKRNFGIDIGDIAKEITKDYVKESVLGRKSSAPVNRSKFAKALNGISEFCRTVWWIPAAAYFVLMLAVIAVKLLANLVGVTL